MDREQRREFVRSHRTALFGFNRRNDGPSMSVIYYVMDGDDILLGTMEARSKAKAVRRNSKVSLCVLDEKWPLTYLLVYCDAEIDATVDTDLEAMVDLGMSIQSLMAGQQMPDSVREATRRHALAERRVRVRLRPYATFESPPRHVYKPADAEGLTHTLGQSMAW